MKWIYIFLLMGCSSMNYMKTVDRVDLEKFGGKWYVLAVRPTVFEKDVHNGVENYDIKGDKIDISFTFNKSDGSKKEISQKGSVFNKQTNAHWKVSPFWPLKFDFLIIDLAEDYSWTAVGVPSTKYLWVMARKPDYGRDEIDAMLKSVAAKGYPIHDVEYVPHD